MKGIDNKSSGTTRLWPFDNFLRFLFTRQNSLFSPAAPFCSVNPSGTKKGKGIQIDRVSALRIS